MCADLVAGERQHEGDALPVLIGEAMKDTSVHQSDLELVLELTGNSMKLVLMGPLLPRTAGGC